MPKPAVRILTAWILSRGIAVSPDNTKFAAATSSGAHVWSRGDGAALAQPAQHAPPQSNAIAFGKDGASVFVDEPATVQGVATFPIVERDATSGKPLGAPLTGHTGPVTAIAVSPDSTLVASVGEDRRLLLWDARTHQQVAQLRRPPGTTWPEWPSAPTLPLVTAADGAIHVFDVASRAQIQELELVGSGNAHIPPVIGPDNRTVIGARNGVRIWTLPAPTGRPSATVTVRVARRLEK